MYKKEKAFNTVIVNFVIFNKHNIYNHDCLSFFTIFLSSFKQVWRAYNTR